MGDYETVCELREIFNGKGNIESVEAPELADTREHFYPHRYLLQRRNRVFIKQNRSPSARNTPNFKALAILTK